MNNYTEYINTLAKRLNKKYGKPLDEIVELLYYYYAVYEQKYNPNYGIAKDIYLKSNLKNIEKFFLRYYNYFNSNPYTNFNAVQIIPTQFTLQKAAEDSYRDSELINLIENIDDIVLREMCKLVISGKNKADIAKILGVSNQTLYNKTSICKKVVEKYDNGKNLTEKEIKILELYLYCKFF